MTVMLPTQNEIDLVRRRGYRPQAVGCCLYKKNVLFVYKKKYNLWQLPQGGVDNGETLERAFYREMTEELGDDFTHSLKIKSLVGQSKVTFTKNAQGSRALKTDAGQDIFMLGKVYFFIAAHAKTKKIDVSKTDFDEYAWLTYEQAYEISQKIYQKGKRRITLKALRNLRAQNLL